MDDQNVNTSETDEQIADNITLNAGDSVDIDNITLIAVEDAALSTENGIFTIISGIVNAVNNDTNSPSITFDALEGSFDFTCQSLTTGISVIAPDNLSITYTDGSVTYYANKFIADNVSGILSDDISFEGTFTYTTDNIIILQSDSTLTCTWNSGYILKLSPANESDSTISVDEDGFHIDDNTTAELITPTNDIFSNITINAATFNNNILTLPSNSAITATLNDTPITIKANDNVTIAFNDTNITCTGNSIEVKLNDVTNTYSGSFKFQSGYDFPSLLSDTGVIGTGVINLADIGSYTINNMSVTTTASNTTLNAASDSISLNPNSSTIIIDDTEVTSNDTVNIGNGYITGSPSVDTIKTNANNITINGGTGNDLIEVGGANNVILYAEGDGNDTIIGLDDSDTLIIDPGYYTTINGGNNLIIGVGTSSITADSIDFHIDGQPTGDNILSMGSSVEINDITYTALENSTLTAKSDATLSLIGKVTANITGTNNPTVTFDSADNILNFACENVDNTLAVTFNNSTVNYTEGNATYTAETISIASDTTLTTDSQQNFTLANSGTFNINGRIINSPVRNIIVTVNNNTILINPESNSVTVDGIQITGNETFTIDSNIVYGTQNDDTIKNSADNITIIANAGDDLIDISDANNVLITHTTGDGNDCIVGFNADDTLDFSTAYSTLAADNNIIFAVNNEYITISADNNTNLNVVGTLTANTLASTIFDGLFKRGTSMASNFVATETYAAPTSAANSETWEITSADNLKLSATHFAPNDPNGRWVVLVHGYGNSQQAVWNYVDTYLKQGYNVLTPDMRAVGNSEGEYLTMGILESQDIALWTQEIVSKNGAALITLHGKDMGAASVLMASARSDIENVTAIIADNSYNNAYEYFYDNLQSALEVAPDPIMRFVDNLFNTNTGYSLKNASPIDAVTSANIATLFVDSDDLYNSDNASTKQQISDFNFDTALAFVDNATPTNIIFNGRTMSVTNAEGTTMSVNTSDYGTIANLRLTLKEIGKALNILISGNNSTVVFGNSSLRTSGSAVTTMRADDGFIKINGDTYYLDDESVSIIMASDNHISSISELEGTISGNFSKGTTAINGTDRIYIRGDNDVTVTADTSNRITAINGVSSGSTVVSAGTNSTIYADSSGDFTVGNIAFSTTVDNANFVADRRGSITAFNADYATIIGSSGNDTIYATGNNVSINAGTGNDYIALDSDTNFNTIDYESGDGNDTIVGLNANDTVNIVIGSFSSVLSGDDILITVADNVIVAKEAANTDFTLTGMEVGEFVLQAGESRTMGDIVYAATDDSTLTANVDNTITINDGKVNATFIGMLNPEISFDASDGEIVFNCEKLEIDADTAMAVTVDDFTINYKSGNVTYYADKIVAQGNVAVSDEESKVTANFNVADDATVSLNNNTISFTSGGKTTANLQLSDTTVSNVTFDGTVNYNRNNSNFDFRKDSVFNATVADRNISLTTSDNAGGTLTFDKDNLSLTFSPYSNDGDLILGVDDRQVTLSCRGTVTYSVGGAIKLASGTTVTGTWDSGYRLTVSANNDVAGSIHITDNGLEITPNDFGTINTSLVTPVYNITNIKFDSPVIYHEGTIILANGSTIIGNIANTEIVISANDDAAEINFDESGVVIDSGDGYVIGMIGDLTNNYKGSFRLTTTTPLLLDGCSVTTNSTSAQKFTLADSGTYDINSFRVNTTAENVVVTAESDTLTFNPNYNLVTVSGRQFSGNGDVTVLSDGTFKLSDGAAVVMDSADAYTIDNIPFRVSRNVAGGVTVAGSDNGFYITHTVTGGVITEKLKVSGDDDYSVQIVASGIGTVSGISSGATVTGGASLSSGDTVNNFNILTDGNSVYTFGDKTYTVTGDDSVLFNADFDDENATLKTVSELDGTISGDFSADVTINGIDDVQILGDRSIDVVASSRNGINAVKGISNGATIAAAGSNSTLTANAVGGFVFGTDADSAITFRSRTTSSEFLTGSADDMTINSGNGTVIGTASGNAITTAGDNISVNGFAGNDTIANAGNNVTIIGGADNDSISNRGTNVIIDAGDGNDIIINNADNVMIDAGSGNDSIYSNSDNATIVSGEGNDFISLRADRIGNVIQYNGGNDSIVGMTSGDTLKVNGNYSTVASGDNLIVNVNNERLVMVDSANVALTVDGLEVGEFTLTAGESRIVEDITFTAVKNTTLTANADDSFTINDGAVAVVLTGTNDPEITFDASDGEIDFACAKVNNTLAVTVLDDMVMNYSTGKVTYYADKITVPRGRLGITDETGAVSLIMTVNDDNGEIVTFDSNQRFTFNPAGTTTAVLTSGDTTIGNITVNGNFAYDRKTNALDVAGNTVLSADLFGRSVKMTTTADAGGVLVIDANDLSVSYSPNSDDGELELAVTTSGQTRTALVSCIGMVTYRLDGGLELDAGTTLTSTWESGYNLSITTNKVVDVGVSLTNSGLEVTPADSDAVIAQLTTPQGVVISNIKVDGTVIYNDGGLTLKAGSALTATTSGNAIQYSAAGADVKIDFDEDISFAADNNGSVVGTSGNVVGTYSGAAFKISSDTDVVILTPNVKAAIEGTNAQKLIFESNGVYNINNKNYTLNDEDGVNLSYSTVGMEISDLEGTISFEDNTTLRVSNDSLSADISVDAAADIGVDIATIKSNGYFNVSNQNDIYTLHSGRAGHYTLGDVEVTVSNDVDYDFLFDSSGGVTLANISNGARVVTSSDNSLTIINDTIGTYRLNGNTISANDETAVTVNSDGIAFESENVTYNGLNFKGSDFVTMPVDGSIALAANDSVTLGVGDYTINDILVEVSSAVTIGAVTDGLRVNREWIQITGDDNYSLKVSDSGIDTVVGISDGVTVKGKGEFALRSDSVGEYTFGDKNYVIVGDSSVDFDVAFDSETATLKSVDVTGTISGDFSTDVEVDGVNVYVTGDENISVVTRNNDVVTISGINDGASVLASGERTLLRLESEGTYNLGGLTLSVRDAVTIANDSVGAFTNFVMPNATITGTRDNDNLTVRGSGSYVSGGDGDDLIVNTSNNSTIAASGNDTIINSGADVYIVATEGISIEGDSNYTVFAGNATTIEGLSEGSTLTSNRANYINLLTDSAGDFTFGNDALTVIGDDSVIIGLYNNELRSVNDLQGTVIFTSRARQTINGNVITLTPTGQQVTLTTDDSGKIKTLDGLSVGSTLNFGATGTFTVNGESVRITDVVNQTITITEDGATVIYPTTTLENQWVTNSTSNYVSTLEGYSSTDTNNGNLVYYLEGDTDANFANTTGKKKVIHGDGRQSVIFNNSGNNIASVQAETSGAKTITLGDGGDIVVIEDTDDLVSIKAGSGADKISTHGDNVAIDLSKKGSARIMTSGGNVTLNNYDHSSGAGIQGIYGADENDYTLGDGYITMLGTRIYFGNEDNSAVFNIYDSDGGVEKIGYTYSDGSVLDLRGQTQSAKLLGRNGNSTIFGGNGNDTIESTGNNYIGAGGGNNLITLNHRNNNESATILATEGRTTVDGFYNNSDKIQISNIRTTRFSYSDGDITVTDGSARTLIEDASSSDGNGDYTTLLLQNSDGDSIRAAITDNATINADVDEMSRAYFGTNAAIDFSDWNEVLKVNLRTGDGTYNGENLYFSGINQLKGGSGITSLIGSAANETLIAGSGDTSLLGGGGNDLLVGDLNKDGLTEYFFTANGGRDTVTNYRSSDKIHTFNVTLTGLRTSGDDVIIDFGSNSLRIVDAVDTDIRYNDIIAKVGANSLTYDTVATYYRAYGNNVTLGASGSESVSIWLSDSKFKGEFKTLDASNVGGNATLAGNTLENVIMAGSGNSSLWGGRGAVSDTLIGGNSEDTFWYYLGNGNDVIMNAGDGDTINLKSMTFDDLASREITATGVNLTFTDGGSLSVRGENIGAVFAIDGNSYTVDQTEMRWRKV